MIKVCKFGGTSMADGNMMKRVAAIVNADKARRYVVVSAPGKRFSGDTKITDLLYRCYDEVMQTEAASKRTARSAPASSASPRSSASGPTLPISSTRPRRTSSGRRAPDFTASRREYLSARVMAELLGFPFIDAREVIKFRRTGSWMPTAATGCFTRRSRASPHAVVSGYYGEDAAGRVKTFSRGGSDISGAIVARAVMADVYENWTDVSGFLACDPHIVENPGRDPRHVL